MATTLDELEQRVAQMEQELARLRQVVDQPSHVETPAERGAWLLEQARREKPQLRAQVAKALEEMGIRGKPVPPEKLREMMIEAGVRPEDNLFSRGIIEMREE
jgi:hypothetical protein